MKLLLAACALLYHDMRNALGSLLTRARYATEGVRLAPGGVIKGRRNIRFARGVRIGRDTRIVAGNATCVIEVGEGTRFNDRCFVTAHERITIGRDVLFSDNVFVCDHLHGMGDRETPVIRQVAGKSNPVEIGDGCWLGINVVILPGVRIGKQCVIGANAVVADDIPDYSVAAGVPARVLRPI